MQILRFRQQQKNKKYPTTPKWGKNWKSGEVPEEGGEATPPSDP